MIKDEFIVVFMLKRYAIFLIFITDLKTLQLKNLSSVNYGIPQFTDITGYLAILRLKRLRTLYIWRSQVSNFAALHFQARLSIKSENCN